MQLCCIYGFFLLYSMPMVRSGATAAVCVLLLFSNIPECRGDENLLGVAAGIAPCIEEILEIFACQEQGELSLVKSPCSALASQLLSGAPFDMIIFSDPKWADWLTLLVACLLP